MTDGIGKSWHTMISGVVALRYTILPNEKTLNFRLPLVPFSFFRELNFCERERSKNKDE